MAYSMQDYLSLAPGDAEAQWRAILSRREVGPGENQVDYMPVETLLCACAMVAIGNTTTASYGSGLARKGLQPIPQLAVLFRRRPTSITSKMANLDGGRSRGGRSDTQLWAVLSADHERLFDLYRLILGAARAVGISGAALPDFLGVVGVEDADGFVLLGQDELDGSAIEVALREAYEQYVDAPDDRPSQRDVIGRARVGQHRFAKGVLENCGWECVFCGFSITQDSSRTLLRASHIKPWRESSHVERRDVRNGVAACPTHDAAFDAGYLTLDDDLSVILSPPLATTTNSPARAVFTAPVLRSRAVLPAGHAAPRPDYVQWHRVKVFVS